MLGLILTVNFGFPCLAADASQTKAVSIDPLLKGRIGFQYETALSSGSSLALRGSYGYLHYVVDNGKYTMHGIGAAYRFYPSQKALSGLYVGPIAEAKMLSLDVINYPDKGSVDRYVLGPGVEFGKQWINNSGHLIDLGISLHYYLGKTEATVGDTTAKVKILSGFGYGLRVAFGFAW
jgi:hypothetical protein